ncbi:NAD(P)-dependent oxidoreductase [Helicobacter valdiviensis]|uniref:NAD(P)-dependent oxidoreductase n=1 Tax=Helicobacter valdiviensis TaxID=1458358 RepID=A0A2W6NEP9_9HELI|nr:SDR family NAD(P)-dependent oxidoreductase [Helicobacter valdiviensis]PZT47460.1 NAD(P)-dependent oxidoreductase [Helicobacter valdiviensis]
MVVCISGASSGIGLEIAREFAKDGNKIIAIARRKERLEELREELSLKGVQCHIIACDIANKEKIKQEIKALPSEFAKVDVLVNNAGLALGLEKANQCNFEDWQRMIDVNISALCYLTHLILPQMVERKEGHIINMGSIAGRYPYPGGNVYGATKAFTKQFSLNLRADLAGSNVRVCDIEPGLVSDSEFSLVRFRGDKKRVEELYKDSKALKPQDIAKAVFWVANLPKHININMLEIMPTSQSFAPLAVYRG